MITPISFTSFALTLTLLLLTTLTLLTSTHAKSCTGTNLDRDAPVKIGTLLKKDCSPYSKSVNGDFLRVHYTTKLYSNCVIIEDSKKDYNQIPVYQLGTRQMLHGFNIGTIGMCVGEKRRITSPAKYAYPSGVGELNGLNIPVNSTLVWDVELLYITKEPPSDFLKNKMAVMNSGGVITQDDPNGFAAGTIAAIRDHRRAAHYSPLWAKENQDVINEKIADWRQTRRVLNQHLEKAGAELMGFDLDVEFELENELKEYKAADDRMEARMIKQGLLSGKKGDNVEEEGEKGESNENKDEESGSEL